MQATRTFHRLSRQTACDLLSAWSALLHPGRAARYMTADDFNLPHKRNAVLETAPQTLVVTATKTRPTLMLEKDMILPGTELVCDGFGSVTISKAEIDALRLTRVDAAYFRNSHIRSLNDGAALTHFDAKRTVFGRANDATAHHPATLLLSAPFGTESVVTAFNTKTGTFLTAQGGVKLEQDMTVDTRDDKMNRLIATLSTGLSATRETPAARVARLHEDARATLLNIYQLAGEKPAACGALEEFYHAVVAVTSQPARAPAVSDNPYKIVAYA